MIGGISVFLISYVLRFKVMIHFAGHPEACFALGDLKPNRNLNVISDSSENLRRGKKRVFH